MLKLLKLGVYVAAGVGAYEVLRRTGLLQKAGEWASQQVPDDFKDEARQYVDQARRTGQQYVGQVRDRAQQIGEKVRENVGEYGDRAQQYANQATDAVRNATGYGQPQTADQGAGLSQAGGVDGPTNGSHSSGRSNGHTGGPQNISGPGRGTQSNVDEGTGVHTSHTVGRGVVR